MSIREIEGGVRIDILVVPKASRARFGPLHGDRIKVSVTSPPVDGAANQAVVVLLAKVLGRTKRDVQVLSGHSSRRKTVQVMGICSKQVEAGLQ